MNTFLHFAGNKIDREDREIPTHVGEDFAQQHNMYFLETSAKEAENVEKLFMQIAEDLMEVIYIFVQGIRKHGNSCLATFGAIQTEI